MRSMSRFLLAIFLGISSVAHAAVTVPPLFGDHMVLQRGMETPVWGKAAPNEKVTVEFLGKKVSATADEKGDWSVKLPAMPIGDAATLTIRGDSDESGKPAKPLVLNDVLVGDVWICSGQSNMQWSVKQSNEAEKEIESAKLPNVRLYHVPMVTATQPTKELHGQWEVCSPKSVADFSAVGFFFGREIQQREKTPVGLIMNPWGGMPAESFTSEEALKADSDFAPILERKNAPTTQDVARAKQQLERAQQSWEKKYIH